MIGWRVFGESAARLVPRCRFAGLWRADVIDYFVLGVLKDVQRLVDFWILDLDLVCFPPSSKAWNN